VRVELQGAELFGHPRGLTVLATTHMWERFSFFGMQALLMLYMTKYLLLPEHARDVLGLAQFRAGLVRLFGPMTDLAFASQTFGIYSGLIYATPMLGAWLGDRVLGKTRTITLGCLMMSAGHLTMASEHLFLPALLLIIFGGGGVIGNMYAQVGLLYAAHDTRRTRAFGVYLITLNAGALVAPLVVGTLGEKVSWHWGFGAAGIGMLIGLATYLGGKRHLPPDVARAGGQKIRLTRPEWRTIAAIVLLFVPYIMYATVANQAYAIMYVWADTAVDRKVLGWEVPVTWIGIFDGLMTILGVIVANRIWTFLDRRGREPHDFAKLAIGYGLVALSYLLIAAVSLMPVVPILLWCSFYFAMDLGFGWTESPITSLVSRDSPPTVASTMMAVFMSTAMFANFLLGWMGRFYEPLGPTMYWALLAAIAGVASLLMIVGRGPVLRLLEPKAA